MLNECHLVGVMVSIVDNECRHQLRENPWEAIDCQGVDAEPVEEKHDCIGEIFDLEGRSKFRFASLRPCQIQLVVQSELGSESKW